jgi:threonine/homoserine efflux transporter RhtA
MIPLPKPRGFWDYGLFALMLTGLLVLLLWLEASDGVGWADAALAFAAAVLCVLTIVLSRRNEKAAWTVRSSWQVSLLVAFGSFLFMFGALYADAYILHRGDITATRIRHDMILATALPIAMLLPLRRRNAPPR